MEYASDDPIWAGVDSIHQATPVLAERAPTTVAVTHPVLSPFAALLPLTKALKVLGPDSRVARSAAEHSPHLLALAQELRYDSAAREVGLDEVLERWRPRLAHAGPTVD